MWYHKSCPCCVLMFLSNGTIMHCTIMHCTFSVFAWRPCKNGSSVHVLSKLGTNLTFSLPWWERALNFHEAHLPLSCSEPNTIVIEGLKCGADDFSTLCYSDLSYVLGHHYVGLLYEHKQCNWIEAANIEPAIKYYLSIIFKWHSKPLFHFLWFKGCALMCNRTSIHLKKWIAKRIVTPMNNL